MAYAPVHHDLVLLAGFPAGRQVHAGGHRVPPLPGSAGAAETRPAVQVLHRHQAAGGQWLGDVA